jgi:hypothetical protein
MVVSKVATTKPAKMILVEWNDMVEQFATHAAHPTLRHTVLPRALNARADLSISEIPFLNAINNFSERAQGRYVDVKDVTGGHQPAVALTSRVWNILEGLVLESARPIMLWCRC